MKKSIILALVEDVSETYNNLSTLIKDLNIDSLSYTIACDMKVGLILMGIGTATSTYPCIWCEAPRRDFAKTEVINTGGKLRTIRSIRENAKNILNPFTDLAVLPYMEVY